MRCKHPEGQRGLLLFSNPAGLLYLSARRRTRAASADPGLKFQSTEGDFKKSCVLRGPEKGSGENVSETKVHQQNRPKETCCQLGTEGVTGTHEEEDTSYFWFQHDAACSLAWMSCARHGTVPQSVLKCLFWIFSGHRHTGQVLCGDWATHCWQVLCGDDWSACWGHGWATNEGKYRGCIILFSSPVLMCVCLCAHMYVHVCAYVWSLYPEKQTK